jgi:HSP20 family molecular chaperone IbpA
MFCPQCHVEYRPGFLRCSDCDVDLVDALPSEPERASQANRIIWMGDDQQTCIALCLQLKESGIRYEVTEGIKSRGARMSVTWRYELAVPAEDEKRAKELLELPETVVEESSELTEEDEDQALLEWPQGEESTPGMVHKGSSYLSPWYPEDATVEVWAETPTFKSDMIEMSLEENQIRTRIERQENGFKKVFVLPEDEAAAREIVREIVEDTPLE